MFSRSSPDTQTQTLPEILLEAMMRENIEIEEVIVILASIKNLNIDQLFADGRTPLVVACQCGNLPLVKLLVETYGAKVDKEVEWRIKYQAHNTTPLMSAISDCPDALQIVLYLLGQKADPNLPLAWAVEVGDKKIVEALLVYGARVKGCIYPPCFTAAENHHAAIIPLLAEWGADINEYFGEFSPLSKAIDKNHIETINTLLELGVEIDPATLISCCKNVERGLEFFNLFFPVFSPENSIEVSLDIDNCAWPAWPPLLTHACVANNIPLIQRFLELGANPMASTRDFRGNPVPPFTSEVTNILNTAKTKQQTEQPVLFEAIKNGDKEKVRSLLEQGVHANQFTADRSTSPLLLATELGHVDIIEILCKAGAKNKANALGLTPLYLAIFKGHLPTVLCLLELGASITKNSIETAMKIRTTNPEIETLLLKYLKEGKNIPINPSDRYVMEKDPVCSLRFFAANVVRREVKKAFIEASKQRILSYLRP
jgi:ankyrin repeat protein